MRLHPRGFGGERRSAEQVKQEGWREHGILVVCADDQRLTWPERKLLRQLGARLFGPRPQQEATDG